MIEKYMGQLINPDITFLAIYVSAVVVIAYIGLFVLYLNNKKLKQENESLKQHLQGHDHNDSHHGTGSTAAHS
ncbi:hypothetical protein [Acinetobacter sp. WZC-1]|uniref:hypothetical protein n=1 Tax=Acinetobacter sp. WZC-1 TaxID=3459034 RepID=UPI00403DBF38